MSLDTPRNIAIYDTTLRDGSQGEGISFSLQDKLAIAGRLAEFGVDYIEGGYPMSNEKDAEFFAHVRKMDLGSSRVCAFGMTRRRGMKAAEDPGLLGLLSAQTPVCTVVGKSWDFHATEVLSVSLEENLAMIGDSVEFLARHCEVVYDAEHFFDGYKANPEYACLAIRTAAQAGAKWIVLCDTNGGTLPEEVAQIVAAARETLAGVPNVQLGIHCHNDGELAIANSLSAIDSG
ncbi:MAG: citramalate synthase, partial [Pirellulaceae bacterium]|nr:citramalate synthase [Pirellulaceae bacterium]